MASSTLEDILLFFLKIEISVYESVSHEIYTYCDQHENKGLDRKLDKEVLKNNSKLCLQIFIWK